MTVTLSDSGSMMYDAVPLNDQCSAVQDVRQGALQTRVAHQVWGLENISVQTEVSFTWRLDLQSSDPDVYPLICESERERKTQLKVHDIMTETIRVHKYTNILKTHTPTFLNSDLNDRQVRRHIFQHTYFSNQVAADKTEQRWFQTNVVSLKSTPGVGCEQRQICFTIIFYSFMRK